MKFLFSIILIAVFFFNSNAQLNPRSSLIRSFKPDFSEQLKYIDLDNDGDPDLIQTMLFDSIPMYWIDDDDDMKNTDLEGDLDNDCLIIDRNRDGIFAGPGDLSLDWVDNNNDGIADMQVIVENGNPDIINFWEWSSNYMWIIDIEQDEIFHYINWEELTLKAWSHYGASNFYEDYHGQTLFQKAHLPSYRFSDLRYSWETPFLFYDTDDDGLTEMAIRLEDSCEFDKKTNEKKSEIDTQPTGKIDRAFLTFDLDNDNGPSNEFDFDMTIYFTGEGFSYADQVHHFDNMRGLPAANKLFYDKRWRTMDELFYADHLTAWPLIFDRGKWDQCWFIFDEDDDCERWERVEMYEPKNPFAIGMKKGGMDNNPQADATGDRSEWDMDNSGKGSLYFGFDGRIHLYGAEKGYWRIDQDAWSYQGYGGLYDGQYRRDQKEPTIFATIAYEDTNNDGFFDKLKYDLNGDTIFETEYDLDSYCIQTTPCDVYKTNKMSYHDLNLLFNRCSNQLWEQAETAVLVAQKFNINYKWYTHLLHPKSLNQKYNYGYWLQLYLFNDIVQYAERKKNDKFRNKVIKAYFSQNWESLL